MSTPGHDLSGIRYEGKEDHSATRVAIAVSKWNKEITEALYQGAFSVLQDSGVKENNIHRMDVPGTFELPTAANWAIDSEKFDTVICLGCVIQGETPHFTFICNAVAEGITTLNIESNVPVIFGVLTTNNQQQAFDRAGGKLGNKGCEAAVAALEMVDLKNNFFVD